MCIYIYWDVRCSPACGNYSYLVNHYIQHHSSTTTTHLLKTLLESCFIILLGKARHGHCSTPFCLSSSAMDWFHFIPDLLKEMIRKQVTTTSISASHAKSVYCWLFSAGFYYLLPCFIDLDSLQTSTSQFWHAGFLPPPIWALVKTWVPQNCLMILHSECPNFLAAML